MGKEKALGGGWGGAGAGPRLSATRRGLVVWSIRPGICRLPEAHWVGGNAGRISFWSSNPLRVSPCPCCSPRCEWAPLCMGIPPLLQLPLRGASPIWPPLLLPLPSPHVLLGHSGVPPVLLGVRGPPPTPGRCPSCEETPTLHPPTLPP